MKKETEQCEGPLGLCLTLISSTGNKSHLRTSHPGADLVFLTRWSEFYDVAYDVTSDVMNDVICNIGRIGGKFSPIVKALILCRAPASITRARYHK